MRTLVETDLKSALGKQLHDLSQPLASLQCRLEIGKLVGGEEALLEAVSGGLDDLHRLCAALTRMRQLVSADDDEGRIR